MAKKKTTTTTTTVVVEEETNTNVIQHDYILLDRSGSMSDKWDETLSSINAYVKGLAKDKINTKVDLMAFDYQGGLSYQVVARNVAPKNWDDLNKNTLSPRGMTPLYDAIARVVTTAKEDNPEKAAIIIMTDGHENSSVEIDRERAKKLLDECRAKGWSVVFLGADFNAFEQGVTLGATRGATLSMKAGNYGTGFATLNATRAMYSTGATATMEFSDDDQQAALGNKLSK